VATTVSLAGVLSKLFFSDALAVFENTAKIPIAVSVAMITFLSSIKFIIVSSLENNNTLVGVTTKYNTKKCYCQTSLRINQKSF
jgi:hypothetical protein